MRQSNRSLQTIHPMLVLVALGFAAVAPAVAIGNINDSPIYSGPQDIEFAQSILAQDGYLSRGDYSPGRRGRATREAIRDFQMHHTLRRTGGLDFETMAMLTSHGEGMVTVASRSVPTPLATSSGPGDDVQADPTPSPAADRVAESRPPAHPAPEAAPQIAALDDLPEMPETAGPVPLLAFSGLLLSGLGVMLLFARRGV